MQQIFVDVYDCQFRSRKCCTSDLCTEIERQLKTYVILQQPQTLEIPEALAKMKASVNDSNELTSVTATALQNSIRELKDQLASNKSQVAAFNDQIQDNRNDQDIRRIIREEMRRAQNTPRQNTFNSRPIYNARGDLNGRNVRTTNGQVICNRCGRVGHYARNCYSQRIDPRIPRSQPSSGPPFAVRSQNRTQDRTNFQRRPLSN